MVIALFGPTGVGKTQVGVELGRKLDVRVLSCDSMQLYPDLPILTNQPDAAALAAVPHEFVRPSSSLGDWNVALYAERAWKSIDEDLARTGWALLVGGTGLYLRAALAPLGLPRADDPGLRAHLEDRGRVEGPEVLHRELSALDPRAAEAIHPRNLRRIVRALEVATVAGPGSWSGRNDLWEPAYRHPSLLVSLVVDRARLYEQVNLRVRAMVEAGVLEEVRRYREAQAERLVHAPAGGPSSGGFPTSAGEPSARGVEQAIGFREFSDYLEGRSTLEEAIERTAAATRRYARRQWTWMRKVKDAVIMDVSERTAPQIAEDILTLARARGVGS
jgi:tRNA dimethylallyltransferase